MARLCSICGRSGLSGHSRSHSNIATKRKQGINLQTLRVGNRRVKACTNCVRTEMKRLKGASAV